MVVSSNNIEREFQQLFQNTFTESDLKQCVPYLQVTQPNPGQLFWTSEGSEAGIYFILEGKIRLLDEKDELIVSVPPGSVLGQISLFPGENFRKYSARASLGLKLGYLNSQDLQKIIKRSPKIQEILYHQAMKWDLLLCLQSDKGNKLRSKLLSILPLLQPDILEEGILSADFIGSREYILLRRGEIIHSSGTKLTPNQLYDSATLPPDGEWLINKTTELYSLRRDVIPQAKSTFNYRSASPAKEIATTLNQTISQSNSSETLPQKLYFPAPQVRISQWWQQLTKRYPFRKQHSGSDCGVACLVMVGEYWGKNFSINQLRSIANVNRSGASIKGLIMAAEHLGFAPRPVKADLIALAKEDLPAIAHWEGNHYIVVYKITRDRVMVSDPKIGRRNLTRQEFVTGWTGYTLLLPPTAKFKNAESAQQNIWKYVELLKPYWLVLLEILIASLMIQIVGLFSPIFTQLLLDRVVVQQSVPTLIAVGAGMLIFRLFRIAISSLRRYLLYHTANKLDLSLIVGFISHTFQLPLSYFETRYVGDITSRINENRKIRSFITGEAITTLLDILSVFVYLALMFWYSWQMSLLALVVIPVFALSTFIATPFLLKVSRESFNARTKEGSYLIESLTGIGTIKSMGVERGVRWRWEDLINESVRISFSGRMIRERIRVATTTIETTIGTSVLLFGVWQVINGQLTIGQLIAFNMLVGNVISPFQRLISLWNDFQEIRIAIERIDDVINTPIEEDAENSTLVDLPAIKGNISFEKVTFRYNLESDRNTLENLSFEIQPGQTVALVGRSGSGKTTIAKLLLGLYTPTEGKILIDGRDISQIALKSLRQQAGVVDQDTFLFGGTILENLTVAHPNATQTDIDRAARLAGAAEFIADLPLKYETQIGEGGGLLSGGQRQRLAIARALLGKPRLLILDEATSNLDAESERIIQQNFNTILQNQTTVVIAHRLSTVRNADLILVMDRGLLVESGTHQELMARKGQYYYLNQQQL